MAKRGRKKKKKAFKTVLLIFVVLVVLVAVFGTDDSNNGDKKVLSGKSVSEESVSADNSDGSGEASLLYRLLNLGENDTETSSNEDEVKTTDGKLMNIYFIDVGQGDCTFIDYGDVEILVDSGPAGEASAVTSYIRPMVDGKLDYVIASHPDADHVGGMEYIFPQFSISTIIDSGAVKNTAVYRNYIQAAGATDAEIIYDDNMRFDLGGGASIRIIETGDNHSDTNEDSVIAWVSYGNFSLLLTGDMGIDTELENLSRFPQSTVLKAAHHGSSYATSMQFLNRVKPDYVIIPVGHNSYGHPTNETLTRIKKAGAKCLTTMNNGNIVISTNGDEYDVSAERQ